tara:strand:- start:365 stop:2944 length:2580 start_codon:yes stop_codon:yes gene_type:complete
MALPQKQYMELNGGGVHTNSTIYTSDSSDTQNLIKIGDILKISGTASNNGIYTVSSIVKNGSDIQYVLEGNTLTNESSDTDRALEIQVLRPTGDKLCVMSQTTSGGSLSVWSTNKTTTPATRQNGWLTDEITTTILGDSQQHIFYFIDNALRICNINEECESIIKWYGFIQRDQFGNSDNSSISAKFCEWQEHPNTLSPPRVTGKYTFSYATTDFNEDKSTNYYQNNRGVVNAKKDGVSDLRLNMEPTTNTVAFGFENSGGTERLDQATIGEVITIDTDLGISPTEYLLCEKPAGTSSTTILYKRAYGGALTGTAPTNNADEDTPILNRGIGWNIAVSDGTSDGDWLADTYEFYETFVYDGNQESLPVQIGNGAASIAAFNHTAVGGKSLRVGVYTDVVYNGRISGGRIYIRRAESDDELTLLLDIDIVQGVRSSMTGDFSSWSYNLTTSDGNANGFYVIPDAAGNCKEPNIDTYTTINGFSNQTKFISIGKRNEIYKDAVVANRRTFIVNVKHSGYTGELEKYGDRLMYSEINRFDTFLENNFIDVSKGDYGEYVAIKTFADRLIAYKHNLVHIINIASPNPANWYLEDTLRYGGINFKYSATNTKYGIAWVSDTGCYLYDGSKVTNLIERKLGVNETTNSESDSGTVFQWSNFVNGSSTLKDAMIGYEPMSNSLIILRSPTDSTSNSDNGFIYDFNTGGWIHTDALITDSRHLTNFFTDWNNNLCVGETVGSNETDLKKFLPVSLPLAGQKLYTKDIDFGDPSTTKKVYAVTITYKSSVSQANPLQYAVNGKQSFSSFATKTISATSDYDIATFTASSPISCGSMQFLISLPSTGTFEINEMSVEYRALRNKTVSDG